jgi:hypothetical protein
MSGAWRRAVGWLGALVLAVGAPAAPLEKDLGQGLRYFRVAALPADLPPAPAAGAKAPACVVDLRFAAADDAAAKAFAAWARFRSGPKAPTFVLVNAATAPALRRVLAARERGGGLIVIASGGPAADADQTVKIAAEDEQRAFAALADGAAVDALITDNPDKVRNDEASYTRERSADAEPAEAAAPNGKAARAPVDAALQRAVHLHRAMVALRRL